VRGILKSFMTQPAVGVGIHMALIRNEFSLDEPDRPGFKASLQIVEESPESGGCYKLIWKSSITKFAENLESRKFSRQRLGPFVNAVKCLHKATLIEALRNLEPCLNRQIRTNQILIENLEPLVNENSRFSAKVLIANYGAMPVMLWAEAFVEVRHRSTGAKIPIESYVALDEGGGNINDLGGLCSIAPGERITAWVISHKVQGEIEDGDVLRTYFEGKSADARVRLKVTYTTALGSNSLWSNKVLFSTDTASDVD
ncbi:hypothetical protein AC249_AIPGENE2986, partial [Exaiptasia diaphana]